MDKKFAVIKLGGVQHIVSEGDKFTVNRLKGEVGDKLKLDEVYLYEDQKDTLVGSPTCDCEVTVEILKHYKGKKMYVRTYKAKSRYRRKKGHRQLLTDVEVKSIKTGSKSNKTKKKTTKKTKKKEDKKGSKSSKKKTKKKTSKSKKQSKKTAKK